jgi:uroporphyrinogen decarboxylase
VVQGNIDPLALVCGSSTLDQAVDNVMGPMKGLRHILNLGHGIVPQTPPDHVASLIARARQFDNRAV